MALTKKEKEILSQVAKKASDIKDGSLGFFEEKTVYQRSCCD